MNGIILDAGGSIALTATIGVVAIVARAADLVPLKGPDKRFSPEIPKISGELLQICSCS